MAAILERLRAGAVAAGRAAIQYKIADALVTGAGATAGIKVRELIMTNKTLVRLHQELKEWGDFIGGVGLVILYELLKSRIPVGGQLAEYLDKFVYGLSAYIMSESLKTFIGYPFAVVMSDGTLYTKNLEKHPDMNAYMVMVDGKPYTYDPEAKAWSGEENIPEGTHDIVVIGAKKAVYFKQYTPAITVGSPVTIRTPIEIKKQTVESQSK